MSVPLPIRPEPVRGPGAAPDCYLQRFSVPYEFPVYFTHDLFEPGNPVFREALTRREPDTVHRVVMCCDDGVLSACAGLVGKIEAYVARHAKNLVLAAPVIPVTGGERAKNDEGVANALQKRLVELGVDRHSFVVGIGGGAVLDLVGYVAATLHRGVRHVRVPTTVLAQADSGVGVKNGVNAFGVKNLVGAFAPPFAVLNDLDFICTLSRRDKRAGLAEAVKVALIRDQRFFEWLEGNAAALANFEPAAMASAVRRCAELHMAHIATCGDPFETSNARPLDYGHWSAHKLEGLTRNDVRHGEAVAIGIALDAHYAVRAGHLSAFAEARIFRLLKTLGFGLWHPALEARLPDGQAAILAGLREFREHLGGELAITLLTAIGAVIEVHEMDPALVADSISWLKRRDALP
ncbi:MAG: 3-dehydroquinate synthase [Proteobacteria bacterium]|nr:3-dehydroquinate synthase [Pseudomonadota bacterium]